MPYQKRKTRTSLLTFSELILRFRLIYHAPFLFRSFKVYKSRYIALFVASNSVKKLFSVDSVSMIVSIFTFRESWTLTLSWQKFLSYRNQTIDLRYRSEEWFLYHRISVMKDSNKNVLIPLFSFIFNIFRIPSGGVFRTKSNTCEVAFLRKYVAAYTINYVCKKASW